MRLPNGLWHGVAELHRGLLWRAARVRDVVPRILSARPHCANLHRGGQGPYDVRLHGRLV